MSKGIAAICLLSFLVLQYGKLASYWECRLSAASAAAICECEKTLLDSTREGMADSSATAIAKEKTEESYLWEISVKNVSAQKPVNHTPSSLYHSMIPEDHTRHIFQPPRA
jgi:hypothetical protein